MSENKYSIFYTDDDIDDQEVFKEIVAEINEEIYIFTQNNGEELMELLNNPPPSPHIIFLDLNMPVKNGYEVLKEIRNKEKLKQLPVVIFSTSNDAESIALTQQLGATMYINKPDSYSHLKRLLKKVLAIDWDNYSPEGKDFVYAEYSRL